MSALARSRELVKGRFFAIALKLFAFTLYIVFPIIIVVALVTMATTGNPALSSSTLVGDLVTEFFSALFAVVSAYAIGQLYRALQIGRPLTAVTTARNSTV